MITVAKCCGSCKNVDDFWGIISCTIYPPNTTGSLRLYHVCDNYERRNDLDPAPEIANVTEDLTVANNG